MDCRAILRFLSSVHVLPRTQLERKIGEEGGGREGKIDQLIYSFQPLPCLFYLRLAITLFPGLALRRTKV